VGRRGSDRPIHSRTIHCPLDLLSLVDLVPISTFNHIHPSIHPSIRPSITSIPSIHPPLLLSWCPVLPFCSSFSFSLSLSILSVYLFLSLHCVALSFPLTLVDSRRIPFPSLLVELARSIPFPSVHPSHSLPPLASCPASESCCCPFAFPLRSSYSYSYSYSSYPVSCSLFPLFIKWLVFCSIDSALETV
jgi:hypothetical protein